MTFDDFLYAHHKLATRKGYSTNTARGNYVRERYRELTGIEAPFLTGISLSEHLEHLSSHRKQNVSEAKGFDKITRHQIAKELGVLGIAELTPYLENTMSTNYGIGSRDMFTAGTMVLKHRATTGFKTKADYRDRWRLFCDYAYQHGIKKMENVTTEFVIGYGQHLQQKLTDGIYTSAAAPKNYLSVVNCVMRLATHGTWQTVRPSKDCGIQRRNYIAKETKALPETQHQELQTIIDDRLAKLMELQRTLGLRFKESCLFDAKAAIKQLDKRGYILIEAGAKGGRRRRLECDTDMRNVIEAAATLQQGQSMLPKGMTYIKFRRESYQQARQTGVSFHSERHAFAQNRYRELVNAPCPLEAGWPHKGRIDKLAEYLSISVEEAKKIDAKARLTISKELGHSRLGISNAYLG